MITPEKIITLARECIGTPFHHQARKLGVGMDCAGPVVHMLKGLDLPVNDCIAYPRHPYKGMMETILENEPALQSIPKNELRAGDVLLMKFRKHPQHLAICCGDTFVHCYSGIGRCVEQSLDRWAPLITHVYRIVDVRG